MPHGKSGVEVEMGPGFGERSPDWTSSPQMYSKGRQWGLVGIILFFFVGVYLGKDGSGSTNQGFAQWLFYVPNGDRNDINVISQG